MRHTKDLRNSSEQIIALVKVYIESYTTNMNALLWVAVSFLYNEVRKISKQLVTKHHNRMVHRNEEKEQGKNLSYRVTALISDILKTIDPRRLI